MPNATQLRQLKAEDGKLKRVMAEAHLEIQALNPVYNKVRLHASMVRIPPARIAKQNC